MSDTIIGIWRQPCPNGRRETMNFEEKLNILNDRSIKSGAHAAQDDMMCAMEAVAWLAGEQWSDKPECACPVISAFVRNWNDSISSDETRRARG